MNRNALDRLTQTRPGRTVRRGFTLVEALLASTILAIVAASVSLPFIAVAQQMQAASDLETATELGEELMEEILARPFYAPGDETQNPGPDSGETERRQFNAVDDFEGYVEYRGSGTRKHLEDYKGADVIDDDMDDFHRRARVAYVQVPDQADTADNYAVRITVKVFKLDQELVTLRAIKVREY